jgi:hypothetical protein
MRKLCLSATLALAVSTAFALLGCESEPCVGDACPDACNGADCSSTPGGGAAQSGRYTKCSSDAACDVASGFQCVGGSCLYACQTHFDCAGVGLCTELASGEPGKKYCSPSSDAPEVGGFYTRCPTTTECDTLSGFECVGAGVGDLDSYCTKGCADDSECPTGFFCDRVSVTPCEAACGIQGDSKDPNCVSASEIGSGKKYQCGRFGPEHSLCVRRKFCSPCETDADCGVAPNSICARDASGEKICTQVCDPDWLGSCPWGSATTCDVWDSELGVPTCSHRFGACYGSGAPCEPCTSDRDCGETGLCYGSSFTGERYCIDFSVRCSCEKAVNGTCEGGGCPKTPGGLPMLCYVGTDTGSPGICLGANSNSTQSPLLTSPQTGCWPN